VDTPHRLAAVGVRLFAIWLAIGAFGTVVPSVLDREARSGSSILIVSVAISAVMGLVALALWFFPQTVAVKLLPPSTQEVTPAAPTDTWLAMGCSMLGLWMLGRAIPALTRVALMLYSARNTFDDTSQVKTWGAEYIAQAILGLWLALGAGGFRRLFWWAQEAGIRRTL